MANEKLMILKMLEDGKISAEEAARLMEASVQNKSMETEQAPKAPPHVPQQPRPYSEPPKDYTGLPTNERAGYTGYSKPHSGDAPWPDHGYSNGGVPPVTRGFDDFASELGRKFNAFARDMEPKLQKFTETVVEKTANMADMISKSVNADTSYPHSPAAKPAYSQERYLHPYATSPSSASAYLEKNF
ncbi:MAG: hypothetical protein LBU94_05135, partial [Clostridiales bacterium]|nr:hypothetical protein [Clostridiales bacterium]